MMSTLIVHCRWDDEMARERTGHPPTYAEAKKMKSTTLHTHGCLGTALLSLLTAMNESTLVPFAPTFTGQTRAFSVVGPSVWNWLPLALRLLPRVLSDTFHSTLNIVLFSCARIGSASE